jgi:hypothetical protein
MAEEGAEETNSLEQLKRSMQYALIKNCDMNEEMRSDAVDLVISATEKYQANYELAARMVKDQVRTPSWDDVSPPGAAHILWERVRSRLGPSLSSSQDGSREGGRRANAQRVQTRRAFGAAAAAFRPLTNIVPTSLVRLAPPCPRISYLQMDKKYNSNWIVAIGQGFSFEVTHEVKHVLWMYFCDIGVLVCKAGARQAGT